MCQCDTWAGKGLKIHNMTSKCYTFSDPDPILEIKVVVLAGDTVYAIQYDYTLYIALQYKKQIGARAAGSKVK